MPEFTTSDDVRLHYLDEGSGPPAILIAGFTAPAESWVFQVAALRSAGYRVISFDRRSHGRSDRPAHGQRMARHGKDLLELLTALDLDDVVAMGGSMGANTIWAYADLFGSERLRAVISVDQTPRMTNDDSWPYGFYGLTRANVGTFFDDGIPDTGRGLGPAAAAQRAMAWVGALDAPPILADVLAVETRGLLRDHAEKDWRDVVDRFDRPALFIAGRDSQFWPCEHAAAAAAHNALVEAVVLEDCGHAANIDQPDALNAAVLAFLDHC